MSQFQLITSAGAAELLTQSQACMVDIRDADSFQAGHVPGARHLGNHNLAQFLAMADFSVPVLVICYHGNSSRGAAQFLAEQGFDQVYSVEGGFEGWRLQGRPVAQGEE